MSPLRLFYVWRREQRGAVTNYFIVAGVMGKNKQASAMEKKKAGGKVNVLSAHQEELKRSPYPNTHWSEGRLALYLQQAKEFDQRKLTSVMQEHNDKTRLKNLKALVRDFVGVKAWRG